MEYLSSVIENEEAPDSVKVRAADVALRHMSDEIQQKKQIDLEKTMKMSIISRIGLLPKIFYLRLGLMKLWVI